MIDQGIKYYSILTIIEQLRVHSNQNEVLHGSSKLSCGINVVLTLFSVLLVPK